MTYLGIQVEQFCFAHVTYQVDHYYYDRLVLRLKLGLCNRNHSEDQKIKENKDSHKIIAASHSCSMVSGNSRASHCFQEYFGPQLSSIA